MYKHRFKKKFGQNFIKNDIVIQKIVESIPKSDILEHNSYNFVEVGVGLGDLTKELLELGQVVAYEIDKELKNSINDRFKTDINSNKLTLNIADVLVIWEDKAEGNLLDKEYMLVANLPYNIATNVILRALRDSNCKAILVMIQKEVAKKFTANFGDKDYSSLSILSSFCGKSKLLFDVDREEFYPSPKVTSSVIRVEKKRSLSDKSFEELLKASFLAPRKKVLTSLYKKYDRDIIDEFFEKNKLSANLRAHEIEIGLYIELNDFIKRRNNE